MLLEMTRTKDTPPSVGIKNTKKDGGGEGIESEGRERERNRGSKEMIY